MTSSDMFRVGIGFDVHRLVEGRRLVLGGVSISSEKGLLGHSDADVVLHAIADALLGAASLGDIGELFPDTDPRYKDADSGQLLRTVAQRVRDAGFDVHNVDVIVHAEAPKLSAHKAAIARSIAAILDIPPERSSVKAKTNEGLGAVGSGDAMACTAIALLAMNTKDH